MNSKTLVDHVAAGRTAYRDALWVIGSALFTGLMAQVAIPLPFTPVPLTGQTLGVLLSGAVLGSRRGFAGQLLYLAAGAVGMPVFAGGTAGAARLLGPDGGYLFAFPIAAGLLGWLVERGAGRKAWTMALALAGADAVVLLSGTALLGALYGPGPKGQWWSGFYPFLAGDALKIALVGLSLPRVLRHYEQPPARPST